MTSLDLLQQNFNIEIKENVTTTLNVSGQNSVVGVKETTSDLTLNIYSKTTNIGVTFKLEDHKELTPKLIELANKFETFEGNHLAFLKSSFE